MGIKLTNNANATLAAGINSSATSITLTSGQGARFPTLAGGDYFYATLVDTSNNLEIVKCTARSTDVLTVVRAQETTTARAYSTGDRIEIRITAQTFIDASSLPSQTGNSGKYLTTNGTDPSWGTVAVTATAVSDQNNASTGYFDLPAGTTAQRPGSPVNGMLRYNTSTAKVEAYQNGGWVNYALSYDIQVLIVAGGGGGSSTAGGGGGGGGYISTALSVNSAGTYAITIGGGGAGATFDGGAGANGASSAFALTTTVGGGGGEHGGSNFRGGGSGGGGGYGSFGAGGIGTVGQGNNGGAGGNLTAPNYPCGGGGGAGGVGGSCTGGSAAGGLGGAGAQWLNGSYYAGGGGGSGTGNAAGGVGGGGRGGLVADATKLPGTANTGGGGGGGGFGGTGGTIGNGGSGIVIVRYEGATKGTGGTITSSGGFTYHTFNSSGTFVA